MNDVSYELKKKIKRLFGQSLHIRHVDSGSSNACEAEMTALLNPIYDIQQYGIDFVASPRHADLLMVTGGVTRNLERSLRETYAATPEPKIVLAVGNCSISGCMIGETYANYGSVREIIPVDVYIPGCPPRPQDLLTGILKAIDKLEQFKQKIKHK